MKWCVRKIVYNANPPAGDAENTKYNWLFSAPLASSIFLNIQVYCDRRTRNFAKLTGFYRKYFVVFIFDFLRVVFVCLIWHTMIFNAILYCNELVPPSNKCYTLLSIYFVLNCLLSLFSLTVFIILLKRYLNNSSFS